MASNITAQSVLEISLGHLECPVCSDRFKQPKLLECSHSFCLECLQQLRQNSRSSTKLSCPVCRQETLLKENGINGLKTNITALTLLEDIEKQETQLKQQQGKQPGQKFVSKCTKHTDKELIIYCNKCKKLICATCITTSHQFHSKKEINAVSDKCKQQAAELIAKIVQSIETFNIAIQEIDKIRNTLDSMFAATKEKISKKADKEIAKEVARITEEKQKLMQQAEQVHEDRVKTIETARATNSIEMNKAEHEKDDVTQIMHQESYEIVHRMEKLSKDLKEYKQVKSTKVPDGLTYMDFREGWKSLGWLLLRDAQVESAGSAVARRLYHYVKNNEQTTNWTLKSEMEMYQNRAHLTVKLSPHDVAAYSNSDIVVSDRDNLSLVTISAESNPQSTIIPQELPIKGLTEPSSVTVNKNDELIVLDNGTVKIFSRNYQLINQFKPDNYPSCIAVDDNNLIAVGYGNKEKISLHEPVGLLIRHVKTLPAPGIGGYLTTYKQRLIYTINSDDSKLVSVDYNGKVVFSVVINQSAWPYGMCCDNNGSICVAVRKGLYSSSGDIHHYSPDGRYIGRIIKECTNPSCIIFTPAGDLVVAAHTSVQIYHCK